MTKFTNEGMNRKSTLDLSAGAKPEFEDETIITDPMDMSTVDQLAFMEDHITIVISRGNEQHSPKVVPVGVNGEQLQIPVGIPCIIKRKFVEALFMSKQDNLQTEVSDIQMGDIIDKRNELVKWTTPRHTFSILKDPAGMKGAQWQSNLMAAF